VLQQRLAQLAKQVSNYLAMPVFQYVLRIANQAIALLQTSAQSAKLVTKFRFSKSLILVLHMILDCLALVSQYATLKIVYIVTNQMNAVNVCPIILTLTNNALLIAP